MNKTKQYDNSPYIDSYKLEQLQEKLELPIIELERNNLLKNVGFKLMRGLEEAFMNGDISEFDLPEVEDIWEDLQFTLGINPHPGYEIDITKGRYGGKKPFDTDWKVDLSVPLPKLGF